MTTPPTRIESHHPEEIGKRTAQGLRADLRLNPGGLLDQAISVSRTRSLTARGSSSTSGRNPRKPVASIRVPAISQRQACSSVLIKWRLAFRIGNRRGGAAGHRPRDRARHHLVSARAPCRTIIPLDASTALRLTTGAIYLTRPSGTSDPGHRHQTRHPVGRGSGSGGTARTCPKPSAKANCVATYQGE